jgi:hypothetical protein
LRQAARALARLALAAAAGARSAGAQYCPAGATTACNTVLVVHTWYRYGAEVQWTLRGTGAFTTVDAFDGSTDTPTAALLAGYDAVLVFSNYGFADAALLGDRLAAHHDRGGGVVPAVWSNAIQAAWCCTSLQGAYGALANGYALFDYAQGDSRGPPDSLGEVIEPGSPLMAGVAFLSVESEAYRTTAPVVAGRGVVVARWRGGGQEPLVVRGAKGARTLVELNLWPVSSRGYPPAWTGDGAALLRNALKYSRCMPCGPGTFAAAAGKGGGFGVRGWG